MQYLTYEEYLDLGGYCDLTAFDRIAPRVFGIIDNATHERFSVIPESAKHLCRDLIELFHEEQEQNAASSKSQTAGAVSESVSFNSRSNDERDQFVDDLIFDYLGSVTVEGVPVLYRGSL